MARSCSKDALPGSTAALENISGLETMMEDMYKQHC